MELVDYNNLITCEHKFKIQCNMEKQSFSSTSYDLLKFCTHPCQKILGCGHPCSGTCVECYQGRIHKGCGEKCGATLVCGHPCPINCGYSCQPCEKQCTFRCQHSACKKKCGEPCTKCKERCLRKCLHGKCTALCGDICTIPPCSEPCQEKLRCGHPCIGFCGDACPPLCRQCNYDELTEIFFGTEDKEDARFVMLDECKHVFESSGLDVWMKEREGDPVEIAPKCCPRCTTVITSTQRYSDQVKKTFQSLFAVKEKYFGDRLENERRREELTNIIRGLQQYKWRTMADTTLETVLQTFNDAIQPTTTERKNTFNLMLYQNYLEKLRIIEDIDTIYKSGNVSSSRLIENVNFLFSVLIKNEKILSKQEAEDFLRERKRLSLLVQFEQLRKSIPTHLTSQYINISQNIGSILNSITVFNNTSEDRVKKDLHYLAKKLKREISQIEFREVIKAMDMKKGHWFKCPNGHVYAIGECGGATQVAKCADCGEAIGGTSHRLLSTNSHAGEIDGSRFAAYSEEANNLNNYQL